MIRDIQTLLSLALGEALTRKCQYQLSSQFGSKLAILEILQNVCVSFGISSISLMISILRLILIICQDIKKVIGCIFVIFFFLLLFLSIAGVETPAPKEMIDDWSQQYVRILFLLIWNLKY